MERHKSALKAARQAVRHQARNQSAISAYRTTVKKFLATVQQAKAAGATAEMKKAATDQLNQVQRVLMKAASKNLMHPRAAARKISRLSAAAHKALVG
jgi:small subunit ribosomal protein S20